MPILFPEMCGLLSRKTFEDHYNKTGNGY